MIPQSYFLKNVNAISMQVHRLCDASESAYAGVVYLKGVDANSHVHVGLVMAMTKVASIKCFTIPNLELCRAVVVAKLISHMANILDILTERNYCTCGQTTLLFYT